MCEVLKESGSGADTTTSNRGAVGGMQILPGTFDGVADKDMDINNPFDNMRAGIRYGMQGYKAAKGDPVLAGAYYYSRPDGFKDAVNNIARVDTKKPNHPRLTQPPRANHSAPKSNWFPRVASSPEAWFREIC